MANYKSNPRQILLSFSDPHLLLGKNPSAPGKLAIHISSQKPLQSKCQNNLRKIEVNLVSNFSGSKDGENAIKSTVSNTTNIGRFHHKILSNGYFNLKREALSSFIPANTSLFVSSTSNKAPVSLNLKNESAQNILATLLSMSPICRPVKTNVNSIAFSSNCTCDCPNHPSNSSGGGKEMHPDVRKPIKSHRYGHEGFVARYSDVMPVFAIVIIGAIFPCVYIYYMITSKYDVQYFPWKKCFPYTEIDPMNPPQVKKFVIQQIYAPNPKLKRALDALDESKPGEVKKK